MQGGAREMQSAQIYLSQCGIFVNILVLFLPNHCFLNSVLFNIYDVVRPVTDSRNRIVFNVCVISVHFIKNCLYFFCCSRCVGGDGVNSGSVPGKGRGRGDGGLDLQRGVLRG